MITYKEQLDELGTRIKQIVFSSRGLKHTDIIHRMACEFPKLDDNDIETEIDSLVVNQDLIRISYNVEGDRNNNRFYVPGGTAFYFGL